MIKEFKEEKNKPEEVKKVSYCANCGNKVDDAHAFCSNCGTSIKKEQ